MRVITPNLSHSECDPAQVKGINNFDATAIIMCHPQIAASWIVLVNINRVDDSRSDYFMFGIACARF